MDTGDVAAARAGDERRRSSLPSVSEAGCLTSRAEMPAAPRRLDTRSSEGGGRGPASRSIKHHTNVSVQVRTRRPCGSDAARRFFSQYSIALTSWLVTSGRYD